MLPGLKLHSAAADHRGELTNLLQHHAYTHPFTASLSHAYTLAYAQCHAHSFGITDIRTIPRPRHCSAGYRGPPVKVPPVKGESDGALMQTQDTRLDSECSYVTTVSRDIAGPRAPPVNRAACGRLRSAGARTSRIPAAISESPFGPARCGPSAAGRPPQASLPLDV
jgi:hypothetical protein